MYKCKECGLAVIIAGDKQIRACSCVKADGTPSTIIIDMTSVLEGKSTLKN